MRMVEEMVFNDGTVRVTWCKCVRCAALGPRLITVIKKYHEDRQQELGAICCIRRRGDEGAD